MNMKKFGFNELLANNTFLMILSLCCAVLVWFVVVSTGNTEVEKSIYNVPVVVDTHNSGLKRLNLEPVANSSFSVDVDIKGPQAVVGSVKVEDILVSARLTNVSGPGTYDLALDKSDVNGKGFEIKGTVPDTITMRFDNMVKKTLPVHLGLSNIEVADGYILNQEYVYPQDIVVSGPATEMSAVASVEALLKFDRPLTESGTYDTVLVLLDANGNPIESPYLTLDKTMASVTLPVLKKKVIPIAFDFVNVPTNFDEQSLRYAIVPSEIEIAGPVSSVNAMTELHLGYVDLRTLEPNTSLFYTPSLPTGYISVESLREINVKFQGEGYATKVLYVTNDNIRVVNQPSSYDITVSSRSIPNIIVYGPQAIVEGLTNKDLVAQIDMTDWDIRIGTATVPVSILVTSRDDCWVYGDQYTAIVTIKDK